MGIVAAGAAEQVDYLGWVKRDKILPLTVVTGKA
jgi:hypothetical protein